MARKTTAQIRAERETAGTLSEILDTVKHTGDLVEEAVEEAANRAANNTMRGFVTFFNTPRDIIDVPSVEQDPITRLKELSVSLSTPDDAYDAVSVSERTLMWHRVGKVFHQAPATAAQAIAEAGLGWNVELRDSGFRSASGDFVRVPGQFYTVRTDTSEALGVVKSRYKTFQNVEAFEFCDNLVDDYGAKYECAFSQYGGKVVGLTMALPNNILVAGEEAFSQYLMLRTSHDGTGSIQVALQMVRLACLNQFNLALRKAPYKTRFVHSKGMDAKISQARDTLKMTFAYDKAFEDEVQHMMATDLTDRKADELMTKIFLSKNHSPTATKRDVALILGNRQRSETIPDLYRGSAYGLMNAFTEHFQHQRNYRRPVAGFEVNTKGLGAQVQHDLSTALASL